MTIISYPSENSDTIVSGIISTVVSILTDAAVVTNMIVYINVILNRFS